MSGIKMKDRTLKGLPKNPEELEEMQFLNALYGLIPKSARIKRIFSSEFIVWAKVTLSEKRNDPDKLDIMALWEMVNKERNDALKENSALRKECESMKKTNTSLKTRIATLHQELEKADNINNDLVTDRMAAERCLEAHIARNPVHIFPGVTIHSGSPDYRDVSYDLQHADHITLDLSLTPAGTSFVVGATGLLSTISPPPIQPPPKSNQDKKATFVG